jgi:hypothetical protein
MYEEAKKVKNCFNPKRKVFQSKKFSSPKANAREREQKEEFYVAINV